MAYHHHQGHHRTDAPCITPTMLTATARATTIPTAALPITKSHSRSKIKHHRQHYSTKSMGDPIDLLTPAFGVPVCQSPRLYRDNRLAHCLIAKPDLFGNPHLCPTQLMCLEHLQPPFVLLNWTELSCIVFIHLSLTLNIT